MISLETNTIWIWAGMLQTTNWPKENLKASTDNLQIWTWFEHFLVKRTTQNQELELPDWLLSLLSLPQEEGSYPRYWVWNSNHERWVNIHNMTNNIFEKKTWYPQRNTERGHDEVYLSFPGVFSFFCLRSFEMDIRLPRLAQNLAK